jgi:hypothetical protein
VAQPSRQMHHVHLGHLGDLEHLDHLDPHQEPLAREFRKVRAVLDPMNSINIY